MGQNCGLDELVKFLEPSNLYDRYFQFCEDMVGHETGFCINTNPGIWKPEIIFIEWFFVLFVMYLFVTIFSLPKMFTHTPSRITRNFIRRNTIIIAKNVFVRNNNTWASKNIELIDFNRPWGTNMTTFIKLIIDGLISS